ncbi:hypothetical protein O6H91_07G106900 [Diphasiastrum complanatum]|uniref:Uncharacterized protein n=3 Tax=Diphasiastrum complanatum TaxID=34168 RepID=A0ACC2D8B8_DIPCM|nr:hypothetical protein O6H91_07G106900 [Diphasiastrum complanatum]KAJ7550573.1 hypothetical protein O6H91_07G106900 [Diphasiastrum complanatum]KAJ7550574.1 hypothetical protein O6H91_07G106900 [Diphasiastrum complanatum]
MVLHPFRLQDLKDELSILTSLPTTLASLGITLGDLELYFSMLIFFLMWLLLMKLMFDPEHGLLSKFASESLRASQIGRVEVERHSRVVASGGTSHTCCQNNMRDPMRIVFTSRDQVVDRECSINGIVSLFNK